MEIILALVVAVAVIFFGALISAGNERQRKAIDGVREQIVLWAMQDLRIKREKLSRDVRVDDPLGWLNKIAARACGYSLDLQVVEHFENPSALVCTAGYESQMVVFTPLAPSEIRSLKRTKQNRLSQSSMRNPLLSLPRNVTAIEYSVLNSGILFDLELPLAWKELTGQTVEQFEHLWMYLAPETG